MTPRKICEEATRRGIRLEACAGILRIISIEPCPADFVDVLRQHKSEILSWLEARMSGMRADERPWLHIARQILAGEFDGAGRSTRESLCIGLGSIAHHDCRQALERLTADNTTKKP